MKKEYLILIVMCVVSITGWSQPGLTTITDKEGKIVVIPQFVNYELNIPPLSYTTYTPAGLEAGKLNLSFTDSVKYTLHITEHPMDMQVLSGAYKPFFDIYAPMRRRVSPMAYDFEEFVISPVNENISIVTYGHQYTWPGSGGITTVGSSVMWTNGRWTAGGGLAAGRFYTPYNHSPGFTGSAIGYTSFQATDWLKLNAWGRYTLYNKDEKYNPALYLNPYQPHTNVGGSMEFKITDKFGVGIGLDYKYNPMRRRMEREQLFYPLFYKGRR
ncbi:MAG: hypothetical protein LUD74_02520 [Tannerellaceae bacterium]|nr:hypothetical protein [Tannerellaceae bacterium]